MNRYALLVGINYANEVHRKKGIRELKYAERDADLLGKILSGAPYDFKTHLLRGEQATGVRIRDVFKKRQLRENLPPIQEDDTFLFFFAGHGQKPKKAGYHLLPYDGVPLEVEGNLAWYDLNLRLRTMVPARRCLCVLDACRDDLFVGAARGSGSAEGTLEGDTRDLIAAGAYANDPEDKLVEVLFGCGEGQCCLEFPAKKQGVLTYFLAETLQEPAVRNAASLTFEELARRTAERMKGWKDAQGRTQEAWHERDKTTTKKSFLFGGEPTEPVADPPSRVALFRCQKCGLRNELINTFKCRDCKREHLCVSRHFDEAANKCDDCAEKDRKAEEEERRLARVNRFLEAASKGERALLESMLAEGIDVNGTDKKGRTALFCAASTGRRDIAEYLLAKGADVNGGASKPLHAAAVEGEKEMATYLLDKGAEVDAPNGKGNAALVFITDDSGGEVAKLLIDRGANVNRQGDSKYTALHWVKSPRTVEILLGSGARIGARDQWGRTPLHVAAWQRREAVVKALLDGGADVNARARNGGTPLHLAVDKRHNEATVKGLLDGGADVNAQDEKGRTPLHRVADSSNNDREMAKLLIAMGADVEAKDDDGKTPLDLAKYSNTRVARVLREHAEKPAKDIKANDSRRGSAESGAARWLMALRRPALYATPGAAFFVLPLAIALPVVGPFVTGLTHWPSALAASVAAVIGAIVAVHMEYADFRRSLMEVCATPYRGIDDWQREEGLKRAYGKRNGIREVLAALAGITLVVATIVAVLCTMENSVVLWIAVFLAWPVLVAIPALLAGTLVFLSCRIIDGLDD